MRKVMESTPTQERLSISLKHDLRKKVDAQAKRHDVSRSKYISRALKAQLAKEGVVA